MIIPPTWTLPDAIRQRLSQTTYGRQRAIAEEGHLLLVLHKPPGPDEDNREGLLFWRSPSGEWQFNRGGPGPGGLKRHIQSYGELESQLSVEFEKAEDTASLFDLLAHITPLARAARNMYDALQSARDAIKGDASLIEMRDLAYDVDRNFDLLLLDVKRSIDYKMARAAEEQSRLNREALHASHRLNILAALFFPLTAITSLFGMNLNHGFNQHKPALFWLIFGIGVLLGLIMKSWVLGSVASPEPKPEIPAKDKPA